MTSEGIVIIRNLWIKKVWEITRRADKWPINLQVKENVVHKIRPGVFYRNFGYPMFRSLEDFISAIEETVYQNPKTRELTGQWLNDFKRNYEKHYGIKLNIPRWRDIQDTYEPQQRLSVRRKENR